jgi:hypothetical protein
MDFEVGEVPAGSTIEIQLPVYFSDQLAAMASCTSNRGACVVVEQEVHFGTDRGGKMSVCFDEFVTFRSVATE